MPTVATIRSDVVRSLTNARLNVIIDGRTLDEVRGGIEGAATAIIPVHLRDSTLIRDVNYYNKQEWEEQIGKEENIIRASAADANLRMLHIYVEWLARS